MTTIPSHKSAIIRKTPSSPAKWLFKNNKLVSPCLDYGCGRGIDAYTYKMDKYDPYYYPNYPSKLYNTIYVTYVLNIVSNEEQEKIIENIKGLLNENGKAYFTVRRDINKGITSVHGYSQRYVELELKSIKKTNSFEIYVLEKENKNE